MAAVRLGRIPLHLREKIVRLINKGKSQREVHRRGTEKKSYFADPLPVYPLITVKTNARVSTRGSKMLPTRDEVGLPAKKSYTVLVPGLEDERSRLIIGVGL